MSFYRFLGIADGVGGWHNEGIDSGKLLILKSIEHKIVTE
jgi:serine/threonine protein phosphatase PrpC